MNDKATLERFKQLHGIVLKRPKIKDCIIELKSVMKKF